MELRNLTQVGIDVGSTFTDAAVTSATGNLSTFKVPTTPRVPEHGVEAAFSQAGIDPRNFHRFIHGTTIITNLLIERTGGVVTLVTTAGFEDVLEMQVGDMPNTYDLTWTKPEPFVPRPLRFGVRERIDWAGDVIVPLTDDEVDRVAAALRRTACSAVAISLLNSQANSVHERVLASRIRSALPGVQCCASSEVDPAIREYERTSTTVLNAYAMPSMTEYITRTRTRWGRVHYMTSGGGAIEADTASRLPISLAFSGPAGGVMGARGLALAASYGDVITFDMGGTSTDVAIVKGGKPQTRRTTEVDWGIPYRFPSFDINSVGAGGGSIAWIDSGGALRIGPRSAGVEPGPACYGRGGTNATVTDVNVLLGLIADPGLGDGTIKVNRRAAEEPVDRLAQQMRLTRAELAIGAWRTVNANMAQAIRAITVHRGIDPRRFSLFCFGGAAGQHAAAVAREMRLKRVVIPAAASVFSAVGMLSAPIHVYGSRTVDSDINALSGGPLASMLSLEDELRASYHTSELTTRSWVLECRHRGQTHSLDVEFFPESDTTEDLRNRFLAEHERLYGTAGSRGIEIVNARLTLASSESTDTGWPRPNLYEGGWRAMDRSTLEMEDSPAELLPRALLPAGASGMGPALILEPMTTVYVPSGDRWSVDEFGSIVIEIGGS